MNRMLPGALALAMLVLVPAPASAAEAECNEPCGYIVPIIDLDFPEKQLCGGSGLIFTGDGDARDCAMVPTDGSPLRLDGTLTWYYDASEEPPYPKAVGEDIEISFSGTRNNPSWLTMKVEPGELAITDADLLHPDHFQMEQDNQGSQTLWFRYQQPISVTFTRVGDPTPTQVERIADNEGLLQVFLKAKSTESSTTYRESFGVEEFRFLLADAEAMAPSSTDDNEAAGPGLPALMVAFAAVVAVLRRRGA